jgi:DNA polymerase III alpha subunit
MIENFEVFYKAFLQFSVNTARRIVKDEHIANDIAHNVFSYFFEHQDMLDFSDEEMLMAKVSSKTRKESFDYMKLSCNRHEMCIIDADNGDEIIDEKSNPETIILELEDKAALAGREITMGGIVTSVRRGVSKNGNPYGIAKIEDYSGSTEIPFWGNDWVTYQGYLNEGTFLYIKARCQAKQWRQDELEIKITSMELLPDVKEELVQKITILIPLSVLNTALVTELATLTKESPGNTELYFKVTDDSDTNHMSVDLISRPIKLSVGRDLITYLKERPELGFRIN